MNKTFSEYRDGFKTGIVIKACIRFTCAEYISGSALLFDLRSKRSYQLAR